MESSVVHKRWIFLQWKHFWHLSFTWLSIFAAIAKVWYLSLSLLLCLLGGVEQVQRQQASWRQADTMCVLIWVPRTKLKSYSLCSIMTVLVSCFTHRFYSCRFDLEMPCKSLCEWGSAWCRSQITEFSPNVKNLTIPLHHALQVRDEGSMNKQVYSWDTQASLISSCGFDTTDLELVSETCFTAEFTLCWWQRMV